MEILVFEGGKSKKTAVYIKRVKAGKKIQL